MQSCCFGSSSTEAVGQSFRQLSPRGARSKGDQQPDGRVAHNQELQNIRGVDAEILGTRVLRARNTRKTLEPMAHIDSDASFGRLIKALAEDAGAVVDVGFVCHEREYGKDGLVCAALLSMVVKRLGLPGMPQPEYQADLMKWVPWP